MDLDLLLKEFDHKLITLGNSGTPVVWIAMRQLQSVCSALQSRCHPEFDRLETILCAEVDQTLMLTYLLGGAEESQLLGVRVTVPAQDISGEIQVLSVSHLWHEAITHENDLAKLFGIDFVNTSPDSPRSDVLVLPVSNQFGGFPMRKQFAFNPPPEGT